MNRGLVLEKYFGSYPNESLYDNDEELKERLRTMTEAVRDLRVAAVLARSITQLHEVHVLEHDLSMIYAIVMQRRQRKNPLIGV